jgi:hypothetical protein
MANRTRKEMLPLCRRLLHQPSPTTDAARKTEELNRGTSFGIVFQELFSS